MVAGLVAAAFVACSSPARDSLETQYQHWYGVAHDQAQAGALAWSQLYQQSYDRLTVLPPSMQQDLRLEMTVLLLSLARKYESAEMSAPQFDAERVHLEARLEERLR